MFLSRTKQRYLQLYDTPRDMDQSPSVALTVDNMLDILQIDARLGIPRVELAYAGSNEVATEAFRRAHEIRGQLGETLVVAFGKTIKHGRPEDDPGLKALIDTRARAIAVVGKAGEHEAQSIGLSPKDNTRVVEDTIAYLRQELPYVEIVFDGEFFYTQWNTNRNRHDRKYALDVMRAAKRSGADVLVGCDTNGGAFYDQVIDATRRLVRIAGSQCGVGGHFHGDQGMAVANSLACADAGASQIHVTWNGLAERSGMADVAQLALAAHRRRYRVLCDENMKLLTPYARRIADLVGVELPEHAPVTGARATAHKAGLHGSALNDYECFPPSQVGNTRSVLLSKLAGKHTVSQFVQPNPHLSEEVKAILLNNGNPSILRDKILNTEGDLYTKAPESFILRALQLLGRLNPQFSVIHMHWTGDSDAGGFEESSATVTVQTNVDSAAHNPITEEATGNGPVNAIANALVIALRPQFPVISQLELDDYKVKTITHEGTASVVQVNTAFRINGQRFSTVGTGPNIITASERAIVDGIHFLLLMQEMGTLEMSVKQEVLI